MAPGLRMHPQLGTCTRQYKYCPLSILGELLLSETAEVFLDNDPVVERRCDEAFGIALNLGAGRGEA